jgi:hypothetical protein
VQQLQATAAGNWPDPNAPIGVFAGGFTTVAVNTIDYITIASQGNAIDFGDISVSRQSLSALSDSHGGLGGF